VGEQVTVTQQGPATLTTVTLVGPVTLTSSADAMFLSAGWELNPGAPVVGKIVPILSKLQNTKIVVVGYTDNARSAHSSRAWEFQTISTSRANGQRAWWFTSRRRV
jgi:flagellar motor protein MotB